MQIARLTEEDWPTLRRLRLQALAEAPAAFWAAHADEVEHGEPAWRSFAQAAEWFVALDGTDVVGMAAGLARPESPDEPEAISMWVAPHARRRGLASTLLTTVTRWAVARGASSLVLWVTDGNAAALQLYQRHGFALTGETASLPRDGTVLEHRLRAHLKTPAPTASSPARPRTQP